MPITVEIVDQAYQKNLDEIFSYFEYVDKTFSTYKPNSEISKVNKGLLKNYEYSEDLRSILALSEQTKQLTNGYFDIQTPSGKLDPSGLVKGWAIHNAAKILAAQGFNNYYVEAGGDIQAAGKNTAGQKWSVGIKNPFNQKEIVKVLFISGQGVATSGTYIRGQHIYNPKNTVTPITDIASLTVIGPNIYEADRFATAAFAMGKDGINFIEHLPNFEGYLIDHKGLATFTSKFEQYTIRND